MSYNRVIIRRAGPVSWLLATLVQNSMKFKNIAYLLLFSTAAFSQEQQQQAVALKTEQIPTIDDYAIYAGESLYPRALSDLGVQGTTVVKADISKDGLIISTTVIKSSESPELDDLSLKALKSRKLSLKSGATGITSVLIPVVFRKDSVANLHEKTCADFNIDLAYFKRTFPTQEVGEMPVLTLMQGAVFTMSNDRLSFVKTLDRRNQNLIIRCAKSPTRKFSDAYLSKR